MISHGGRGRKIKGAEGLTVARNHICPSMIVRHRIFPPYYLLLLGIEG